MPAPSLIEWNGLTIEVAPDGTLARVCLAGHTTPVISDFRVVLGNPWQLVGTEVLMDEVEQRYELAGAAGTVATAVVRQVFDTAWSLRLQMTNLGGDQLTAPAARLDMTTTWPLRRWLAGAEGSLSLDVGRDDGALLTFTQLRGRSRLSENRTWLTDLPVLLGPAGTAAATYQVGWRADWLRDERMQAAALPGWWPERHVLAEGDMVELRLPDAAIEAAGISILEDDETTVLSARPGHHVAQVHAGRGTTDVELFWTSSLVEGHLVPTARELLQRDPRSLADHEVFLLGRAQAARPLGDEAADHLADAVAVLAARATEPDVGIDVAGQGSTSPLGLAAVADEVIRTGAPEVVEALGPMATGLAQQPGSLVCLLHANLASRLAGTGRPLPLTPAAPQPDEVSQAVVDVERLLLDPPSQMPRAAMRLSALLGAGLPGVVVDELTRARIWAVTGLFPEGWEPDQRWPVTLGMARDLARDELLARRCSTLALAWLLW